MKSQKRALHFMQVIVIVLFVIALFVPHKGNQNIIAAIAMIGIIGTLLLFLISLLPNGWKQWPVKRTPKRSTTNSTDMETLLLRQISYQITGKLQSAYPKATWEFLKSPSMNQLLNGVSIRIRTRNTGDYNFAEFHMDAYGSLSLSLMTIASLKRQAASEEPADLQKVDPESWYSLIAKPLLIDLIGDLQAKGHQKLFINENGDIYIQDDNTTEHMGSFDHFPPKNYWPALTDIFINDELEAKETEHGLEISWA